MSLAIPGGRGLFSQLQRALNHGARTGARVRIGPDQVAELQDWLLLTTDLKTRPTTFRELLPGPPHFIGACDAAASGMGGVWFSPHARPIVWRMEYPAVVQSRVSSASNPDGDLTNSDLELLGAYSHLVMLARTFRLQGARVLLLTDNTPTLHWVRRGSLSRQAIATRLLRLLSLHQRLHGYRLELSHIAGPANVMADDASRRFDLDDAQFMNHFTHAYPQSASWQNIPVPTPISCALISELSTKTSAADWLPPPWHTSNATGAGGASTATPLVFPEFKRLPPTRTAISASSRSKSDTATSPPPVTAIGLAQWRTPSVPSVRRTPHWGPLTRGFKSAARRHASLSSVC